MTKSDTLLLWYVPVIHQGYLNLLTRLRSEFTTLPTMWLLKPELIAELTSVGTDLVTLQPSEVVSALTGLGWPEAQVLPAATRAAAMTAVQSLITQSTTIIMIDDEASRQLWSAIQVNWSSSQPLPIVRFESVFLRWDTVNVHQTLSPTATKTTDTQAQKWMQKAKKAAEKSSDWWRQVGAIAVKNDSEIAASYNQGMPTDHTPYQQGAVRDMLGIGEQPELANYIHAEQALIAEAAANGVSLAGADLYVTHFPCPVCAKLVVKAGFKRVLFATGSATLDGQQVLDAYQVKLLQVIEIANHGK